jgi:hypothetical protein
MCDTILFVNHLFHCWFRDPELAKKIGAAVALEVRATGIPFIFAPCLAVRGHDIFIQKLSPLFHQMHHNKLVANQWIFYALNYIYFCRCAETQGGVGATRASARTPSWCSR